MTLLLATVTQERLLKLPQEVQAALEPGQQIQIHLDQSWAVSQTTPNEKALAALREIARRQEGRRHTDGALTDQMLREGRNGAMYGDAK
jgi:hypothetical protein